MSPEREPPLSKDELRRAYREEHAEASKPAAARDWQSLIEEQIAKIDVDALAGKGKPLNLDANPYLDPADELAHRMLRNAGFTLPWIDDARQIDAHLEAARRTLQAAWDDTTQASLHDRGANPPRAKGRWQASLREFEQEIARINREIRDYNLKAPSVSLHKFSVRVEEELARLGVEDLG